MVKNPVVVLIQLLTQGVAFFIKNMGIIKGICIKEFIRQYAWPAL